MSSTSLIISNPWSTPTAMDHTVSEKFSDLMEMAALVAKKELREDEQTRQQCLAQFKEWIRTNPDIQNCLTDDCFLLRFLRAKKFSLSMAQQTLLKYLNLRKRFPHIFNSLDYTDSKIYELVNNGYIFASPFRDAGGRRVIFTIGTKFDTNKFNSADMARAHVIAYETILDDEINQIIGVTHLGDASNCGTEFVALWPVTDFITLLRWGEQSFPMRHKQIHVVGIHPVVKYVYDFIITIVSQKFKSRVHIYDSAKDLQDSLDPKILPKEYGGVMPMAEMIDLWKKELASKRDRLMSYDTIKLLSDRGIIRRKNKLLTDSMSSGSFRKLEVD